MQWAVIPNALDLGLWQISSISSDGHTVGCVGYCTIIHEKRPKFYFTWDMTHRVTCRFRGGGGGSLQGVTEGGLDRSSSRLPNSRVALVARGKWITWKHQWVWPFIDATQWQAMVNILVLNTVVPTEVPLKESGPGKAVQRCREDNGWGLRPHATTLEGRDRQNCAFPTIFFLMT